MRATVFEKFIDDAAVFPPGRAQLSEAVSEHLATTGRAAAPYVGPLVLPLDQVQQASELAAGRPIMISVVVPAGGLRAVADLLPTLPATTMVVAVELKVTDDGADTELEEAARFAERNYTTMWAELPAHLVTDGRLIRMYESGIGLKFRTGGITRDLFPTAGELLTVLSAAVGVGIRFKLTAGLHRALRYCETGDDGSVEHFGFLNIAASVVALRAGDSGRAVELLGCDDGATLVAAVRQDPDWRTSFVSFGCCSIVEPLTTLAEIGAVDRAALDGLAPQPHPTTHGEDPNR